MSLTPVRDEPPLDGGSRSLSSIRLVSGSFWVFLGRLLATLAGLLVNALLVRILAPSEVGTYFIAYSLVLFATTVAQLGLKQVVVRLVATSVGTEEPAKARAAIRSVLGLATAGAIAVGMLLALGPGATIAHALFHSALLASTMIVVAAWVFVSTIQGIVPEAFRGFHEIRTATLFENLAGNALLAAALATLWILGAHVRLLTVVTASMLSILVVAVVSLILLWRRVKTLPRGSGFPARNLLTMAWPLLVTSVLMFFVMSGSDVWILGIFRPESQVAVYGATVRLVALVVAPLLILLSVVPPIIAEMHARAEDQELEAVLRTSTGLAAIPSVVVLAIFMLFGATILGWIFGPFYERGETVLVVLSIGQVINVWTGACGSALIMTGHQRIVMAVAAGTGVVSVGGALLLARPYGPVGVAVATSSAVAVQQAVLLVAVKRRLGIWTYALISPRLFRKLIRGQSLVSG